MSVASRLARAVAMRAQSATASRVLASVPVPTHQTTTNKKSTMSTLSGGAMLSDMAKENPYKDVVRYEHKNRKWNLQHVDYYSDALAIGLLENGLQPGDVVLSWLPSHFSESVSFVYVCLFVCLFYIYIYCFVI